MVWADEKVADELDRIPFEGFTAIEELLQEIPLESAINPEIKNYLLRLKEALEELRPGENFADLWDWVAQVERLNEQLETCQ